MSKNMSCANCAYAYRPKKLDYSQGGCKHEDMDGFICMAFADERIANWMYGLKMDEAMCEVWKPKEVSG